MHYLPLLYELVLRDIKIKYRRSVLGVFWTVLNPLLMMLIIYLIFSRLFRFDIENYAIYILCGQTLFNYFQTSTTEAMLSIISNGSLIKKIYMPKYLFVLAKILSGMVNLLASFLALLLVMLFTKTPVPVTILASPLPMLLLMLLSLGMGLMLAAVAVRFRDMVHLYGVFCMGLFYLTPVIYPMDILPEFMKNIVTANPLSQILFLFRQVVLEGTLPGAAQVYSCVVFTLAVLLAGGFLFRRRQDYFILDL